jgi:hypothetical protein
MTALLTLLAVAAAAAADGAVVTAPSLVEPSDDELAYMFELSSGGTLPVYASYLSDAVASSHVVYSAGDIASRVQRIRESFSISKYAVTDRFLVEALVRFPLVNKRVLVVGSTDPTYEAVALAFGAREVVVSEYNTPRVDGVVPGLRYVSPAQLRDSRERFDACIRYEVPARSVRPSLVTP